MRRLGALGRPASALGAAGFTVSVMRGANATSSHASAPIQCWPCPRAAGAATLRACAACQPRRPPWCPRGSRPLERLCAFRPTSSPPGQILADPTAPSCLPHVAGPCPPGTGGASCDLCDAATWSAGGSDGDPNPTCQPCPDGWAAHWRGADDSAQCTGEPHAWWCDEAHPPDNACVADAIFARKTDA